MRLQVIEYCMLGICFCRFTSPEKSTHGLHIANTLVLATRSSDGAQVLSCRVAYARKHHLLNCSVRLYVAIDELARGQGIRIEELALTANSNSMLWLPCVGVDGTQQDAVGKGSRDTPPHRLVSEA